jgi:hypothetical protein
LFAAAGNAELSNKLALHAIEQKVSVIKTFYLLMVLVLLWRDNII